MRPRFTACPRADASVGPQRRAAPNSGMLRAPQRAECCRPWGEPSNGAVAVTCPLNWLLRGATVNIPANLDHSEVQGLRSPSAAAKASVQDRPHKGHVYPSTLLDSTFWQHQSISAVPTTPAPLCSNICSPHLGPWRRRAIRAWGHRFERPP